MIPVRVGLWTSRVLLALALLLFAATFVYPATLTGSSGTGANGGGVTYISEGEMRVLLLMFSGAAWCFLGFVAIRGLMRATSYPRALLGLGVPVGMAIMFAAPACWDMKRGSYGGVAAFFVVGFVLIIVSRVAYFLAFGAREVVGAVRRGVSGLKDESVEPGGEPGPKATSETLEAESRGPVG